MCVCFVFGPIFFGVNNKQINKKVCIYDQALPKGGK